MNKTKIEWTDMTWNPITGCTKISPGCLNCYAERMAKRLQAMGLEKYKDGFEVRTHEEVLDEPLKIKKPKRIFVCSMGDLFHEDVPDEFFNKVFEVMRKAYWHTFFVLTKRPGVISYINYLGNIIWQDNIYIGVAVETGELVDRIDSLFLIRNKNRFVSFEPLLGPINENLLYFHFVNRSRFSTRMVNWVIVGGESGPGARPMKKEWVTTIKDVCIDLKIPFFFKQWGGVNKKKAGRLLEGRTWDEIPSIST